MKIALLQIVFGYPRGNHNDCHYFALDKAGYFYQNSHPMEKPIYLDYNATTPLDPQVLDAMLPYLKEDFGNPSSKSHAYGWDASAAVENARKIIAEALNCDKKEILFTSGATESNNLAILGMLRSFWQHRPHIITSNIEHKAVLDVCKFAEDQGAEVTFLPVDQNGQVQADQVENAIKPNTRLVSIMMANNEIGTINPIKEIGKVTKSKGIFFHTDAAQGFSKVPIDVEEFGIDMLSLSGHKIYGPKGVGALYVRRKNPQVVVKPIVFGGAQEQGVRPGTLNVPGIVGLAAATRIALEKRESEALRLTDLRDYLIQSVQSQVPTALLNGHPTERLFNNISFSFEGLNSDLFSCLKGLAVSSSSACSSQDLSGSYVIKAIGRSCELAQATLRIGLGRFTTKEDVDLAIDKIVKMAKKNQEICL